MRDRTRQDWYARLQAWWGRTEETLHSKWWLWPILLAVDLFWHSVHVEILHALEARSGGVFEVLRAVVTVLTPAGLAVALSALILLGFAIHAYFDVRKSPAVAETQSPTPEPLAPDEAVERFRAFHHFLARAVQWSIDFLDAGICGSGAPLGGPKAITCELTRELIRPSREHKEHLDNLVLAPGEWTASRLDAAGAQARTLLNGDYRRLTGWIGRVGDEIMGDRKRDSGGYHELLRRHWELCEEARRIRTHSRLGGIVPTLDIEGFLPGQARQGSTISIDRMSAEELRAHVRSEGTREFIGKEWSPPELLTITGRRAKALDCRTTGGYPILLPDLNSRDIDHLMQPGNRIYVWGTIKEVDEEHVLLSPAELIKVESD